MPDPLAPDDLDPAARAAEVADLLAAGYLRHRVMREGTPPAADRAPAANAPAGTRRQAENDLEAPGDQSVHVPTARS